MSIYKNVVAFTPVAAYKDSHKESSMTKEEVASRLAKEYQENPVFKAAADIFKKRERNRHNLTTRGLYYKMRKEGFSYQEKELVPVFKLLSDLGVAKAHADAKGRLDSLRHFAMPIQAIGETASTGTMPTRVRVSKIEAAPAKSKTEAPKSAAASTLTVHVNGKPVQITIPNNITKDELLTILSKFTA